jgi:hypothetical protein
LFARGIGVFLLSMAATTAGAQASSFVFLGKSAPASTPSIIALGAPAPVVQDRPEPRTDPSLDPMQQALIQMEPGSWRGRLAAAAPIETPSIIALGEPLPEVADEKVAAIPEKAKLGPPSSPMVIRGGIAGGAFAPAAPTAASGARQAATSAKGNPPEAPKPPETKQPAPAAVPQLETRK